MAAGGATGGEAAERASAAGWAAARSLRLLLLGAAAALLSACGGGVDCGGVACGASVGVVVTGPVAAVQGFAVQQATVNLATQPLGATLAATDGVGNSYVLTFSSGPSLPSSFNGVAAATNITSQTLTVNGVLLANSQTTRFLLPGSYELVGSAGTTAGSLLAVTTAYAAPAVGYVGQTYPGYAANIFRDSTQTVLDGTVTQTLVLQPDTATTAWLCLDSATQPNTNGLFDQLSNAPAETCLRIDGAGNILGFEVTMTVNGVVLTFR